MCARLATQRKDDECQYALIEHLAGVRGQLALKDMWHIQPNVWCRGCSKNALSACHRKKPPANVAHGAKRCSTNAPSAR